MREAGTDQNSKLDKIKDLGVPKFLVNKWLNIQNGKSKFVQKSCQIDNSADVSMASEYTVSNKSIAPPKIPEEKQRRKSRFLSSFDIPDEKESDEGRLISQKTCSPFYANPKRTKGKSSLGKFTYNLYQKCLTIPL